MSLVSSLFVSNPHLDCNTRLVVLRRNQPVMHDTCQLVEEELPYHELWDSAKLMEFREWNRTFPRHSRITRSLLFSLPLQSLSLMPLHLNLTCLWIPRSTQLFPCWYWKSFRPRIWREDPWLCPWGRWLCSYCGSDWISIGSEMEDRSSDWAAIAMIRIRKGRRKVEGLLPCCSWSAKQRIGRMGLLAR